MEESIEIVAAKILSMVESRKLSLRHVMEDFFDKNRHLENIRGVVRAYLLGLLRKYRVIDELVKFTTGIDVAVLDVYRRSLIRSIVYEAKFRSVARERLEKIIAYIRRKGVSIDWRDIVNIKSTPVKEVLKSYSGAKRVAIEYSLPDWVARYLIRLLGPREAYRLFKAFNTKQPTWIRVVRSKISRNDLLAALEQKGFNAFPDKDLEDVIGITGGAGIARIPEHREGLFVIQEKASSLVGHVLRSGKVHIDLTAAPGLKLSHSVELDEYGIGVDIKLRRIASMNKVLQRIGFRERIDVVNADSRNPPLRRGLYDVIVDPDCSSLGRLGVSPEMRLWVTQELVQKYSIQQRLLLAAASETLKEGGCLVYSTCTLTVEENEENVRWAAEHLGLELVEARPFIGVKAIGLPEAQRLYPHINRTIGFFVAKMCKG